MKHVTILILFSLSISSFFISNYALSSTDENPALREMEQKLSDSSKEEAKTPFMTLKEMYESGTMPTIDGLFGWFSGRCYHEQTQEEATSGILIGEYHRYSGPLFPRSMKIFRYSSYSSEDTYDILTVEEINYIEKAISSNKQNTSIAEESDGTLSTTTILRSDDRYYTVFKIKKVGDYYVVHSKLFIYNRCENESYCYYFKKVK